MLQRPELFEGLQTLQDPLRQGGEGAQECAAVGVDPVVLVVVGPFVPVADEGHGGAGKIEGEEPAVEDDLDGVRVGDLLRADDPVDQRGHGDRRVLPERPDHLVHLGRLEEGLIALDVDDDRVVFEIKRLDRLGDPVRPRPVAGGGHHRPAAEGLDRSEDPLVVGRHGGEGDALRPEDPLIDVPDHRLPAEIGEWLPGKAGRFVARRDDADDLDGHGWNPYR